MGWIPQDCCSRMQVGRAVSGLLLLRRRYGVDSVGLLQSDASRGVFRWTVATSDVSMGWIPSDCCYFGCEYGPAPGAPGPVSLAIHRPPLGRYEGF